MAYAEVTDLRYSLGERASLQFFDDDGDGTEDDGVIAAIQADGDAIINGYVGRVYSVAAVTASPPPLLKRLAVAVYAELGAQRRPEFVNGDGKSPVRVRYEDAMSMLKQIGKGEIRLDVEAAPAAPVNIRATWRTGTTDNDDPAPFIKDGTGEGGF